ncbi:MAG TPA: hypothetical protein VMB03_00145, partial [Bryobacteraceae bacterium]|nr:hypothetical protein [Bryobacteraceae bacterium]
MYCGYRKVALEQGTSDNRLVRDFLANLVAQSSRRRIARARLQKAFGRRAVGEKKLGAGNL